MSENEHKYCRFCGEEIKAVAIKCKHCGSLLTQNNSTEKVGFIKNNKLPAFIIAGIIILSLLAVSFIAMAKWEADREREREARIAIQKEIEANETVETEAAVEEETYGSISWNGGSYEGELSAGKPHGQGEWSHPDGDEFVGEWENGKKINGYGTTIWESGAKYIGEYNNGERHGKGAYYYDNGNVYIGVFVDGSRTGQGTYVFANGNEYVGDFLNDKFHGNGKWTWQNGDVYVGDFLDDKFNGYGTLTGQDGFQYVGNFVDGEFHGEGAATWPSGREYIGEWKDGKRHGLGALKEASGAIYIGGWKDDKFHGEGVAIAPDGRRVAVKYNDGVLISKGTPQKPDSTTGSHGSTTTPSSSKIVTISYWAGTYRGEVMNGVPHGQGTLTWPSGTYFTGRWERGQFLGNGAGSR